MSNETANAPAKRDNPVIAFMAKLDERERDLAGALEGTGVSPRQFLRAAKTSVRLNLDLAATSFNSFWNACLRACRDGLLPDGVEGAIVPYKTNATWIPMYAGKLRQFRRSGKFQWIGADVVRQGDTFENYVDQDGQHFKHEPKGDGTRNIIKCYAAAKTLDNAFFLAVLSMADINKIRATSRAGREDSPWNKWPEEMMKKSALHRLAKFLPSARDAMADEDDDEIEELSQVTIEPQRPRLVGAEALDEFAGGSPDESAADATPEGSGGSDTEGVAPATSESEYDAYQRGKLDRSKGVQQRGIPGELREPARSAEAIAWIKGWKGEPL